MLYKNQGTMLCRYLVVNKDESEVFIYIITLHYTILGIVSNSFTRLINTKVEKMSKL